MRKVLLPFIWIFLIIGVSFDLQGQSTISSVSANPPNPLACDPFTIVVSGNLQCANAVINSVTYSLSGSTINVDINVTQPPICLPAIIPYTDSVTLPPTPAGTYSIVAEYVENGVPIATQNGSVTIGTCCATDASFVVSSNSVCQGEPVNFLANTTDLVAYNWKVDGVVINNDTAGTYIFGLPGMYNLTLVAVGLSCTDSSTQIITVNDAPTINFSKLTDESCPGSGNGSITVQPSGTKPPFSYLWANGDTTATTDSLGPGTYQVIVTNSVGCQDSASASIGSGFPVVANFSYDFSQIVCTGDTLLLTNTSSNAQDYQWYANGQKFSQDTNALFIPMTSGVINVKLLATNTPSCRDSITYSINTFESPEILALTQDPSCPNSFDGYISLNISGGTPAYTYSWSNGASGDSVGQLGGGVYSVLLTDASGCDARDTFLLTPGPGIEVSLTADPQLACSGDTVLFIGASPDTGVAFSWYRNNQLVSQTDTLQLAFPDSGFFEVLLVGSDGVCSDSADVLIEVSAFPNISATIVDESCPGVGDGAISLQASGSNPVTGYSWSNGATTPSISNLTPGAYSVAVSNSAGCTTRDTFNIAPGDTITANFIYAINQGDTEFNDLSGPNASSWFWDFGDGNTSTQRNPNHTYLVSGTYTVCLTVQNSAGCEDRFCDTVLVNIMVGLEEGPIGQLRIFPNPGQERFFVEIPDEPGPGLHWNLTDLQGRKLKSGQVPPGTRLEIYAGNLPPGIFLLNLTNGSRRFVGRLTKM